MSLVVDLSLGRFKEVVSSARRVGNFFRLQKATKRVRQKIQDPPFRIWFFVRTTLEMSL